MTLPATIQPDPAATSAERAGSRAAAPPPPSRLADLLVLSKVRLNSLVVFTSGIGCYLAARPTMDLGVLAAACVGTALVASGAAALNQVSEADLDAKMHRTENRPVPTGRLQPGTGRLVGLGLAVLGTALLAFMTGLVAAGLAVATLVIYIVIYTPMKRRTSLSTVVGAIPGAMPPLIGWTAGGGSLAAPGAWALFVIIFFWQLPHFLAISWLYRDDYARADFPMLAVIDRTGVVIGRQALVWAAALVPTSLVPAVLGLAGPAYAVGALVLGIIFTALAAHFALKRTRDSARLLFLGSIIYLPALWILLAVGR
jgi:protoheme IX farnesyltransferase